MNKKEFIKKLKGSFIEEKLRLEKTYHIEDACFTINKVFVLIDKNES